MIETIEFQGSQYPKFQASGFAARFIFPFAMEVCKGQGLDIGANRPEWKLPVPGCWPIDPNIEGCMFDAMHLPHNEQQTVEHEGQWDYIFSSHCLEHLNDWVGVLDYWHSILKPGGVLFLYLPHPDQQYWKPWNNRKHVSVIKPLDILEYLKAKRANAYVMKNYQTVGIPIWKNSFVSQRDLNHSFAAMAQKA